MPSAYRLFPSAGLGVIRHWGRVCASQIDALLAEMRQSPAFRVEMNLLIDTRDLTETDYGSGSIISDMLEIDADVGGLSRPRRHAVLTGGGVSVATARMFQNMSATVPNLQVRLFDDPEAATAWLGLAGGAAPWLDHGQWDKVTGTPEHS